jgi:intein-encoded DNA endonuclease-like protein
MKRKAIKKQCEIAKDVHLSPSTISKAFGNKNVKVSTLSKACKDANFNFFIYYYVLVKDLLEHHPLPKPE